MPDIENDKQQTDKANEAGVEEDTNAEAGQETDGEQQENSESEGEENAEDGNEDSDDEGGDDDPDEELDLERAKAKITKANDEAKNLRTRLRETEEKLKNAKSLEEVDALVKQITEDREKSERALLVENVALKHKLPDSAIKRLSGNTREELEADAKELADLLGTIEDDEDLNLEGGLNPRSREDSDPDDPRALAQKYGRRGKRR